MLNQTDIDKIMQDILEGKKVYLYYTAHMIEGRETNILDEHMYKSVSRFKIVKVKVNNVCNAYFEKLNFLNHPEQYHVEEEECYYTFGSKYIHYFSVKNSDKKSYSKDINPRTPSNIYGYRREIFENGVLISEYNDPSPVKEVYTNNPKFGTYPQSKVIDMINKGGLSWKYLKLNNPALVDGIDYNYVTSDWYILDLENYPMIEKPLINTKQYSGYFMTLEGAFRYIEQLQA